MASLNTAIACSSIVAPGSPPILRTTIPYSRPHTFTEIGKERGWPPTTRAQFDAVRGPTGALLIGDAETVAEKILYVNDALGGISRITFQMGVSTLPHQKMLRAIEILGTRVAPIVRRELAASPPRA